MIIVYILHGRTGFGSVTSVSNHLINDSTGHSGYESPSRCRFHFLWHIIARSFFSIVFDLYHVRY